MTSVWSCPKEWTLWAKCVYNKSPFSLVYLWQINNGNCWCTVPSEALQTSYTGPFVSQHLSTSLNLHSCERVREHWSIEGLLSACTLWWRSEGECAQHTNNSSKTSCGLLTSCRHAIYRNHCPEILILSNLSYQDLYVTQTQNTVKFKCKNLAYTLMPIYLPVNYYIHFVILCHIFFVWLLTGNGFVLLYILSLN